MSESVESPSRFEVLNSWLSSNYEQVTPYAFYRDMFPKGSLQQRGTYNDGKYRTVALAFPENRKVRRYLISDEMDNLGRILSNDWFTIISPCTYAGKRRLESRSREMMALAVDLDRVIIRQSDNIPTGMINAVYQQPMKGYLPQPTYTVCSGNNIHLYYFFDKPLRLFPNVIASLNRFRAEFIGSCLYTSDIVDDYKNSEILSVTQGMRAVGTVTKDPSRRATAYRTGERISIEELNRFVKKENQIKPSNPTMTLEEAKVRYPKWYKAVTWDDTKAVWYNKRDLFDWWVREVRAKAQVGHRYFAIYTLGVLGSKCNISEDEMYETAFSLVDDLDAKTVDENNHFLISDVITAVEGGFNQPRMKMTRAKIEQLSGIKITPSIPRREKGKRLPQKLHLAGARNQKALLVANGMDYAKGGRPSKRKEILEYVRGHRCENQTEVARSLGISRQTVNSHWKSIQAQIRREERGEEPNLFDVTLGVHDPKTYQWQVEHGLREE